MSRLVRLIGGGAIALAASVAVVAAESPIDPPPTRAVRAVAMLAAADAAAALDTPAARNMLRRMLAGLDALGVQDPIEDRAIDGWRARLPPATLPVERGRVLGPAYRRGWLEPGSELRLQQLFVGGEPAEVAVAATPGAADRVTVGIDEATPRCGGDTQCRWLPLYTHRYTIVVRNRSAAGARFYLVMD